MVGECSLSGIIRPFELAITLKHRSVLYPAGARCLSLCLCLCLSVSASSSYSQFGGLSAKTITFNAGSKFIFSNLPLGYPVWEMSVYPFVFFRFFFLFFVRVCDSCCGNVLFFLQSGTAGEKRINWGRVLHMRYTFLVEMVGGRIFCIAAVLRRKT